MPFIEAAKVILIEVRMMLDSQKVENTLWAHTIDTVDGTTLAAAATAVKDWWVSDYGPLVSDLVTLREVVATDQTIETGPQVTISGEGAAGGQIGGCMPNNVTLSVSFHTTSRGRSFRGRNYIVGIPVEQLATTNAVEATWAAGFPTAYEALREALDAVDWTWGVLSRFSGVEPDTGKPIPRASGLFTPIVSATLADLTIDSQRRRLPGRGQ
jgi:hypothetical protein